MYCESRNDGINLYPPTKVQVLIELTEKLLQKVPFDFFSFGKSTGTQMWVSVIFVFVSGYIIGGGLDEMEYIAFRFLITSQVVESQGALCCMFKNTSSRSV